MDFFANKNTYPRKLFHWLRGTLFLLFVLLLGFLSGCQKKLDYFDYVSELRSTIFLAQEEDFSLRIYAVKKETPYLTDGIPQEVSPRFEAYLVAPDGSKTTNLSFEIDGRIFGGEMSFDNVKREYFYSCTLDISALDEIACTLQYGERELKMTAKSVLDGNALSPKAALEKLTKEHAALFSSLSDAYGFAGEIYLRLIYEESAYYYIGVIDRTGKINAFLMNAESGKILAKREG